MFARASHGQAVVRGEGGRLPALPWRWIAAALVAAAVLAALWLLAGRLADPDTLPIRKIRVEGALAHLDEGMLRRAIAGKVQGGFFSVDVERVRQAVEALPWVRRAAVRRIWPDTLQIRVSEQQALAAWGRDALVNVQGEVFRPAADARPQGLPRLVGPAGQARIVSEYYRVFSDTLAPAGLAIAELKMDERHAFRLRLRNGIALVLGREQVEERLDRFVRVWRKALAAEAARIARVDLRYGSGLAVQWKHGKTQTTHGG